MCAIYKIQSMCTLHRRHNPKVPDELFRSIVPRMREREKRRKKAREGWVGGRGVTYKVKSIFKRGNIQRGAPVGNFYERSPRDFSPVRPFTSAVRQSARENCRGNAPRVFLVNNVCFLLSLSFSSLPSLHRYRASRVSSVRNMRVPEKL